MCRITKCCCPNRVNPNVLSALNIRAPLVVVDDNKQDVSCSLHGREIHRTDAADNELGLVDVCVSFFSHDGLPRTIEPTNYQLFVEDFEGNLHVVDKGNVVEQRKFANSPTSAVRAKK
jgi:hypothetical protein